MKQSVDILNEEYNVLNDEEVLIGCFPIWLSVVLYVTWSLKTEWFQQFVLKELQQIGNHWYEPDDPNSISYKTFIRHVDRHQ